MPRLKKSSFEQGPSVRALYASLNIVGLQCFSCITWEKSGSIP